MNKEKLKNFFSNPFVMVFLLVSGSIIAAAYYLFSDYTDISANKSTIPINSNATETNTLAAEIENQARLAEEERLKKEQAEKLRQEEEEEEARLKQEAEEEEKKRIAAEKKRQAQKNKVRSKPAVVPKPAVPQQQHTPPTVVPSYRKQINNRKKSKREWNDSPIEFMSFSGDVVNDSTAVDPKYSPWRIQDRVAFGTNTGNNDFRYVITQEQTIPVMVQHMVTSDAKNSRWLGSVLKNVTGRHGNVVLIPKGSTVLGTSGSFSAASERLEVSVIRIMTPTGDLIFQAGDGYDQDGAKGVVGELDNRYWDRYVIPGMISIGADVVRTFYLKLASSWLEAVVDNGEDLTVATTLRNIVSGSDRMTNAVVADILRRQLSIEPVIVLPRGTRIELMLLQDVIFEQNS